MPKQRKKQLQCANCKGPHVASYKGCPTYKKQAFIQQVVVSLKSYASNLGRNAALPQAQDKSFTFSDDQLIKFIANVAIQVAQPQVCYANPTQDAVDKKSSLCRRVSEAAKNHSGVDINGISLLDAIGQLHPSVLSARKPKTSFAKGETPFKFTSSTKVIKPSAILKSLSPLAQLIRLSPNSLNPLNRTPSRPSFMTGI